MVKDRKCCVYNCKSNNLRRHLHRFPASEEIRRQWLDAIGDKNLSVLSIKKLKKKFVCSEHFESQYYSTEVENKLLSTAVPTIFNNTTNQPLDTAISLSDRNGDNNREDIEPTVTIQNGMKTIVLRDSRYEDMTLVIPETFTISVRRCSPSEEDSDDWFGTGSDVPSDSTEWEGDVGIREILVDDLSPTKEAEETGRIKIVDPTREPIPVPSILDCLDLVPRNGTRCFAGTATSEEVTIPCNTLLLEVGEGRCQTGVKDVAVEDGKDGTSGNIQRLKINGMSQSKSSRIMHNLRCQPDVKLNVQCTVLLPKVEICVSCDTEYSNDISHVCRGEKSIDSLPRANFSAKAALIERYSKRYSNAPSLFECELCTEIFDSADSLYAHKRREHDADVIVKSFKCVLCPQSFEECSKLTSHIEKSHIFQCDACNEIFVDEDGLREHEIVDHGKSPNLVVHNKPNVNDVGGNNFGKSNFVVKREMLNGRKPTLPICCLESFQFQLAEQNKKVLKPSNVYMCHLCSKYMYKCADCEHIFRTQHGMNIHFNKEHGVRLVKKLLPECCNVSFYKHLSSGDSITASDITGKPIVCDACFENIYNCSVCREIFRTKYRLNKHVLKEHGETKVEKVKLLFKCSVCLQTFSEQYLLDSHIRREHRFKCQTCCENFKTKFDLNKHIVSVHMSNCVIKQGTKKPAFLPNRSPLKFERPFLSKTNTMHKQKVGKFQCFKCAKSCANEAFLRQHIRDVHSTKRWECVTCRGIFETEISLNDHIVDIHCSVAGNKILRRCNVCKRMFDNRWSIWGHVAMKECNHGRRILGLEDRGPVKAEPKRDDGSETNWAANMKIIKIEQIVDEDNCEEEVVEVDPLKIKEEIDDMDIGPEVLQYSDQRYSNCVEECAN